MTLSPEPKEGGVCISLKLQNGSRHQRKFNPDASIQDVFRESRYGLTSLNLVFSFCAVVGFFPW